MSPSNPLLPRLLPKTNRLPAFAKQFSTMFFAHDPALSERLQPQAEAMMVEMGEPLYLRQCDALDTRPDLRMAMAGCTVPTRIIAGAEDRICPPRLHEALAEAMPDASLEVLDGCGHIITLERPDAVIAALHALA